MDFIDITYKLNDEFKIIIFNNNSELFCLSIEKNNSFDLSELFNILTEHIETDDALIEDNLTSIKVREEVGRNLWSELIERGFERVEQLENIFNQKQSVVSKKLYKLKKYHEDQYSLGRRRRYKKPDGNNVWIIETNKIGKTWNNIKTLKKHVSRFQKEYEGFHVVEFSSIKDFTLDKL
jgi:hypothetical protein